MSFKKAKVVMLPTKEKADIYECPNFKASTLVSRDAAITQGEGKYQGVHLYIISDDEIKNGDYMLHPNEGFLVKDIWHNYPKPIKSEIMFWATVPGDKSGFKKVIATTDKSLSLPQPSESFIQKYIEAYNKKEAITDVLVEYEIYDDPDFVEDLNKEMRLTPLILEKIKINPKDNTITIRKQKDSWSREEVKELLWQMHHEVFEWEAGYGGTEKFIEENL